MGGMDQPSERERREHKRSKTPGLDKLLSQLPGWAHNHPNIEEALNRVAQRAIDDKGVLAAEVVGILHELDSKAEEVTGVEVSTWVDKAMFSAEDIEEAAMEAPKVYLLSATPDPLGSVAAMSMMYEGRVIRDLSEITDDERRHYYDECFKTTLKAPLEAIDFHFLVEGITRAHSHQEVRQRTAVFAQESMRFAVKEKIAARPGPIIRSMRNVRDEHRALMMKIWESYNWMIAQGVPAEEARGILPHDTLTRLHHKVNLRNLMDELGKRLCTQAQFDWKLWASEVRRSIREHKAPIPRIASAHVTYDGVTVPIDRFDWQFKYIADSPLFVPICFNSGRCMFKASMDRGCTIRERVERGAFSDIRPEEWAADPTAGWTR